MTETQSRRSSLASEPSCPVCYGGFGDNAPLPCGHTLCLECENRIKAGDAGFPRCPMCRAPIPRAAPAVVVPPPVPERVRRLAILAHVLNSRQRNYTAAELRVQAAQQALNDLALEIQRDAQEFNNLVAGDVSGETRQAGTAVLRLPTPALAQQMRAFNGVEVGGNRANAIQRIRDRRQAARAARAARDAQVVAAPPPPPPAVVAPQGQLQPQGLAGNAQGHKCGHQGCARRGRDEGVQFRRMTDGRRLFRCADHAF